MSAAVGIYNLLRRIEPVRVQLASHEMYARLASVADVRIFMEHHIFAVWDFMALLKALQRHLTCTESMWRPTASARARRLINQMVLEEESDEIDGVATSHLEVYRAAMMQAGADVSQLDDLFMLIGEGTDLETALRDCGAPASAQAFVRTTFEAIASNKPHVIAAAFTFGREEAIPNMFRPIIDAIPDRGEALRTFEMYLDRHIHLDEGEHAPMAVAMLADLCGGDLQKWTEAADSAVRALTARIEFWTAISKEVASTHQKPPHAVALDADLVLQ